ncbi:hypothetical protein D1006_18550 [Burkholderia stabilis]|uniref:SWIM-type domain-containing protein n=1 Tax=Burkholderia stabilis TaxID=95485 RepID=A0A4Q2AEG6_9BURK|nr:hypothetical protein D1006_18550 [Burkholderia stabilis]
MMRMLRRWSACVSLARTARCAAASGTQCGCAASRSGTLCTHVRRRASPIRVARSRHACM